jgi:hypothetical protein
MNTPRVIFPVLFLVALAVSQDAPSQPKLPLTQVVQISLTNDSVSPAIPIAGQPVSVSYTITAAVPTAGVVVGEFQGANLPQAGGGNATIKPDAPLTGTMVIPAPIAGTGTLTVSLVRAPNPNCTGNRLAQNEAVCGAVTFATAKLDMTVVEPTVHVRIAGTTYSQIARKDNGDGTSANGAYQCVVHNPGCGSWGNDGNDLFFSQKSLPPGAKLEGTTIDQYWPTDVDSATGSGPWTWLDSAGTYYAHLNSDDPVYPNVKWNNTCSGGFSGKNLNYAISFLISMPKGTDLGEPSYDKSTTAVSTCAWGNYSPIPVTISSGGAQSGWSGTVLYCNPSTVVVNEYLHIRATLVKAYTNAQGSAGPMVEDNLKLTFNPAGSVGSTSGFSTSSKYQQGTWQITSVYITPSPTSPPNATVKSPDSLSGLPITAQLPSGLGAPVFDFRGGNCL